MKLRFAILFVLVFQSFLSLGQSSFRQPTDAADCTTMLFQALQDKNTDALANLLANDFSLTSFQGREVNKEFLLGSITKGYLTVENGMLFGARSRNYQDVTVVTGTWNVRAKVQNATLEGEMAYMSVCIRVGGNWKVSMMQLTPVQ